VDKDLLKTRVGPILLANLSIEVGSGFRNFIRKRALGFELLATITGLKVSRQDINYGTSTTVNEITFDFFPFLGLLIPHRSMTLS
jgi:hypothetical protein